MATSPNVASLITRLARMRGIDPAAVLAVAKGEGGLQNREGDIGDLAGGGSYGPFQLYAQGALPAHLRGKPQAADQWAWSPAGIAYALDQMKSYGASGLRGADAVRNIITRFERPANPAKSISLALSRLGMQSPASPSRSRPGPPISATGASGNPRQALLSGLAAGKDVFDIIPDIVAARGTPSPSPAFAAPNGGAARSVVLRPGNGLKLRGPINELIHDPQGSIFDGLRKSGAYGGHGGHVHFADTDPQDVLAAIKLAQRLGLAVRENPYVDPVDPVHTEGSHHYRVFPGLYNGRKLGQGIDVSGPEALRRRFFAMLAGASR